jgi:hypothetical protein
MIENQNQLVGQLETNNEIVGQLIDTNNLIGEITTDRELVGEIETNSELIGEIETNNELVGEISTTNELIGELSIGTGGGTLNYENLYNKPKINNVELIQNKSLDELGIQEKGEYPSQSLSNKEIDDLLNGFVG